MKKVFKITIILMILFIMFFQTNFVKAGKESVQAQNGGYTGTGESGQTSSANAEGTTSKGSDQTIGGKSINPGDWNPYENKDPNDGVILESRAKIIITAIRNVGIVISVIILMIIGIKEMTASVEEKTILKKSMPGYILGAILVFAITVIPTILYEIANDLF